MPSLGAKALRELRQVALVTAYFLVCFGIIALLKKLLLAQYDIRVTAAGTALVGALVVAKVVVILDQTRLGERFRGARSLGHVAYKSLVYTLAVMLVVAAEHLFHAYREAGTWAGGWAELTTLDSGRHLLFTGLCVLLSFVAFNLYTEIDAHLGGDGALRRLLTSRREERGP